MSIIGLSAILATFFLIMIGMDRRCQAPFAVLLAIPLVQLGGLYAALAFVVARPFDTDTITYFYDVLGALSDSIKPGTSFIVYLTDALVRITDGSFDDIMAIYSISGVLSSFLLLRYGAIAKYQGRLPILCSILILLPTFHFYTTAIGKDGLSALALTLIIIGATHFPSRMKTLGAGFVLLTLVRPHIAAFAAAALLLSQMIGSNNKTARLAVVPLIVISPVVAYFVFDSFLGINVFDLDQVSNFLGERNDALSTSNYVINSSDNIIVRIFGLLYFPLFFNADSAITLFASLENIFLIFITARITLAIIKYKMHRNPNVVFLATTFILLSLFMGITNYNIGLGLRLKSSMIFPIFMALLIVTEMRRLQETSQSTDHLDIITN